MVAVVLIFIIIYLQYCVAFSREQRVTGTLVFIMVGVSAFMAKILKV